MNNHTCTKCTKGVITRLLFPILLLFVGLETASAQTTYNSSDIPKTIPATGSVNHTITSTLTITGSGMTIGDLNVGLNITHSYLSDIEITLSKGATSVILFNNSCGSSANINMIADDEGSTLVCPPLGGNSYQPNGGLSSFNNITLDGTWTLTIVDSWPSSDGGSLNSWSLIATEPCLAVAPTLSK
ncbi:MAG: proprotein convertase P-domain-containing protein [Chitinophagales bacterium]